MALSGIQIYKYLPKTNCKECGFPTCLAFAMKLSQRSVELSLCPYVTPESKSALEAASRPPIRLVTVSSNGNKIEVGNEVVMFRHEKTFYHPPGLVIRIKDNMPEADAKKLISEAAAYSVERVGIKMTVSGFAVENASKDVATFAKCVEKVKAANLPLILMSDNPAAIAAALEKCAGSKPLIYAAKKDNWQQMVELAKKAQCPLTVCEPESLDALAALSEQVNKAGIEDIVLDSGARDYSASLTHLTQIRRLAVKKNFYPLGYPVITFPGEGAKSDDEVAILAAQQIAKYAGIIVLDSFSPALIYPLLTLRLNVYTDPQKPIQVKPGIYEILTPKPQDPLMVSTNFSLTYFSVAGEVESSRNPTWLLICDTEGLSVLTAWAAGKFDAEKIAKTVKQFNVEQNLNHKKLILPGKVAILRGELEEELPGWQIMVGPPEAMEIGSYLKKMWK